MLMCRVAPMKLSPQHGICLEIPNSQLHMSSATQVSASWTLTCYSLAEEWNDLGSLRPGPQI